MPRTKGSKNKEKKEIKPVVAEEEVKVELEMPKELLVSPITDDFGREDLNRLRDRFNELVEKVSK